MFGRWNLPFFFGASVPVAAFELDASVDVALSFFWKRNRLRPAVRLPRPFGASVVVVEGASLVVVVFGVVVVVVVGTGLLVVLVLEAIGLHSSSSSQPLGLSRTVESSSPDTVVISLLLSKRAFLSSSLAFSFCKIAYKSIANFSINGVVSSVLSDWRMDDTVVLASLYSKDDFEMVS